MQRWYRDAACRDLPTDVFYPESACAASWAVAKRVCDRCPVWSECLSEALTHEGIVAPTGRHGMWGGWTPDERSEAATRYLRERELAPAAPLLGGDVLSGSYYLS